MLSTLLRRRRLGALVAGLAIFAGLFVLQAPPANAAIGDVLFIVKYDAATGQLRRSDSAAKSRMEALGLTVHVVEDSKIQSSDLAGMELIAVSDSNRNFATKIANIIKNAPIPIVSWENDDHPKYNFGALRTLDEAHSQTTIDVTASHPVVAGLSGPTVIITSKGNFGPSKALPEGQSLATVTHRVNEGEGPEGETGAVIVEDAIIVLDAGKKGRDNKPVPARRVGLPFEDGSISRLTSAGKQIFDNAILWALGDTPPPSTNEAVVLHGTSDAAFDAKLVEALQQLGFTVRKVHHNNASQVGDTDLLVVSHSVSSNKVADTVDAFGGPVFNLEPFLAPRLGHATVDGTTTLNGDVTTSDGVIDVLSADGPLAKFTAAVGSTVLGKNADGSTFLIGLGDTYSFGFHDQTPTASVINLASLFQAVLDGLVELSDPPVDPPTAVVLTGSGTHPMDTVLVDALTAAGFDVRVVNDRSPGQVGTPDALVISYSVASGRAATVAAAFSGVVINTEPYLADDLGHADRVGPVASSGQVTVEGQAYDVLTADGVLADMTTRPGATVAGTRGDGGAFVWNSGATWTIGVSEDTDPASLSADFDAVLVRILASAGVV